MSKHPMVQRVMDIQAEIKTLAKEEPSILNHNGTDINRQTWNFGFRKFHPQYNR
jgi:hypothetical protein